MRRQTPKWTAANREKLIQLLRAGNTVSTSCKMVGIHRSLFYQWLAKGEAAGPGTTARKFFEAVVEAEASSEVRAQVILQQAMVDDPKWAAWYLERRNPEDWGKRERHEVSGPGGAPIRIDLVWPEAPTPPSEAP